MIRHKCWNSINFELIKLIMYVYMHVCDICVFDFSQSTEDNSVLLSHGALLKCSTMLVTISGDAVEGNKEEGLELVCSHVHM